MLPPECQVVLGDGGSGSKEPWSQGGGGSQPSSAEMGDLRKVIDSLCQWEACSLHNRLCCGFEETVSVKHHRMRSGTE